MKKITILSVLILTSIFLYSQAWEELLPKQKKENGTLTLKDYQKAFNDYWAPYNVDRDGYYYKNGEKIKAAGWKNFKRWEWMMQPRVNKKTGEFPKTSDYTEWKKYLQKFPEATKNVAGNWTSLGLDHYDPTIEGNGIGQLGCVAFHPTDTNTFWVGAGFSGLWVTYDGGNNWQVLNDDLGVLGIADIAIPSDYDVSQTLYIATGSRDKASLGSLGVLKSTDGGATWQETGLPFLPEDGKYVYRLLMHPGNNQIIYAATSIGVYKTTDGGDNWDLTVPWKMVDLEFHPTNPNIIYGGDHDNGKIYRTINGGDDWDVRLESGGNRVELAVTDNSPNTVYAIISGQGHGLKGIYKSLNSGGNFFEKIDGQEPGNNFLSRYCDASIINTGQGDFDLCIAVNPENANEVIIGGILTWKSTNGGTDWHLINSAYGSGCVDPSYEYVHVDHHWLEFQPGSNTLFEVNDGGIYKSYDYEYNWINLSNGLEIAQIYRVGVSQTVQDLIIAGTHHNGSKRLQSNVWWRVTSGDGMGGLIDYTNSNIQYGSSQNGALDRTIDNWLNKENISPGEGAWVTPYILDPVSPNILYVGTKQLHKSTDIGDNYNVIFDAGSGDEDFLLAIAVAPSNTDVIYCSNKFSIWKTLNGGTAWQNVSNNLPLNGHYIVSMAVKETDENTIWVSLSGYDEHGVYKSTDGGQNWTNISYGLPNVPVYSVVQNKLITGSEELYVGTSTGVFIKVNENTSWVLFNNNLPFGPVHEVEIYYNGSNSKIVAGTWGRGVWQSELYSYESNADAIWTGIKSSDWFDADNWQYAVVPGQNNDVTIPAGNFEPIIAGGTASCKSLTIESGATLEIVNNLDVDGNFNNYGEFIMSGSNANIDIAGNVTFKDGSTADIQTSGASISVEGSWLFDELSNAQLNNGTVVFTGLNNRYIRNLSPTSWFHNITVSKDPNKYVYFSSSSTNDLLVKGDLFITGNSLYRHYSSLNTIIEGVLFNYGRILCFNGGFELAGSGTPIQSNGNSYFNNLIISSGANSINDNLEIRGDIIFNGGTLEANANEIYIEGNWINNLDNAAFVAENGRVVFEGDDGQSITGDVNFYRFENNISSGYINIEDEVLCSEYDWTNGGIKVSQNYVSEFTALSLADNGIYGDYLLDGGEIELHSSGTVHLCGNLTINGGYFNVYEGTINSQWPGFTDASLTMTDGVLDFKDVGIYLNSSAQSLNLDITGGEIKTRGYFYDTRGDFNPSGGEVCLYGQYNAAIDCIPGSSFYDLKIDKETVKGNNKSSKSSSVSLWKDVEVAHNCIIEEGEFDINGKSIYVDGFLSVRNGGTLAMTDPADIVNAGYVSWNKGSMSNITDGDIILRNDWTYNDSTLAELSGSNKLILNGSNDQTIKVYDENASFSSIRIEKTGGNVYTDADYINDIYIRNHLYIITQTMYFDSDNVDVEGTTYIGSAGTLIIGNGSTIETGNNTLLGDMEVANSDVVVNQAFYLHSSGALTIEDTGSFVLEKPYDGSMFSTEGSLVLNGGEFEITHNGMEIGASGNIIFNGGDLKIGGNFYVPNSSTFNPNQGEVEFIGSNNGWINMASGNSFHDLVINKDVSSYVLFDSEITIDNDLFVQTGELKAESNAFEVNDIVIEPQGILNPQGGNITISGNWTNNHGTDGFVEDGGLVTFTDYYYSPSTISTDETFNYVTVDKLSPNGKVTLADNTDVSFMQLEINDGNFMTGNNNNVSIGNDANIAANASLIMPGASPASTLSVTGEFSINNNALVEIGPGIEVSAAQLIHDGTLTINGGSFDCSSSLYFGSGSSTNLKGGMLAFSKTIPSWLNLNGTLTMTGGTFDAQSNSISFNPNFIGNLTGGTFTTNGSFKAGYDNIFQQNGGEVLFGGDADSTLFLADGCYVNDFTFSRTGGTLTLLTDLNVANNFTINSGYFNSDGLDIFVGRNWANYAGAAAINLTGGSTHFNSDRPASILTNEDFFTLFINKSFADGNYLDVPENTVIQVNKHFIAMDGMLSLNNNCELSVIGGFQLQDGAGIYVNPVADTATIRIKYSWDNQNTVNNAYSGFMAGQSTVVFEGTFDQLVNGASYEEKFYNLVIQKPSGEFKPNVNMYITNDIIIDEGVWTYGNTGLYYDLYGNLTVNPNGSWQDDENTLYFSSSDDVALSDNSSAGSLFGQITIYLGNASTNLMATEDFNCKRLLFYKGIIALNNLEVTVTDWLHIYDDAILTIENNSILKMGDNSDVLIDGGLMSFLGTATETPLLTRESTGYYSFTVDDNGSLEAHDAMFEYMDSDGIHVVNTGSLAGYNPFKNCTFRNGEPGGTLLKLNNQQEVEFENVTFPQNTWSGQYNVTKENNIGEITFTGSQGDFSGEAYENDINSRINWQEANISVFIQVHLEGPYENGGMSSTINDMLPLNQPYSASPWNYTGTESVSSIPGNEIVDWVLVELRDATDAASATGATTIARKAAFVIEDGAIVGLSGNSFLNFNVPIAHNLYVVVWHRNHLPVMSANPLQESGGVYSYFFPTAASQAYGDRQNYLGNGDYGMISGDANADGIINAADKTLWQTAAGTTGYLPEDFDLDGQVGNKDKNDKWAPNNGEYSQIPD